MRTLLLGGSAEARELAGLLGDFEIVSSLAGRLQHPTLPHGEVRVGGFGGVDGLRDWLFANNIGAVIVATHPFAARMTANAVAAAATVGIPILIVRRPEWQAVPGDRWIDAPTVDSAAQLVEADQRVFLTIGRQGVGAFAENPAWFLIRSIDPPSAPLPARHRLLLERGPFTTEHELALLIEHRIELLVTKNSGGDQTAAKLSAARAAEIPVVLIARPPLPAGAAAVDTVGDVASWLREQRERVGHGGIGR